MRGASLVDLINGCSCFCLAPVPSCVWNSFAIFLTLYSFCVRALYNRKFILWLSFHFRSFFASSICGHENKPLTKKTSEASSVPSTWLCFLCGSDREICLLMIFLLHSYRKSEKRRSKDLNSCFLEVPQWDISWRNSISQYRAFVIVILRMKNPIRAPLWWSRADFRRDNAL